jgi:hypothetical protein
MNPHGENACSARVHQYRPAGLFLSIDKTAVVSGAFRSGLA